MVVDEMKDKLKLKNPKPEELANISLQLADYVKLKYVPSVEGDRGLNYSYKYLTQSLYNNITMMKPVWKITRDGEIIWNCNDLDCMNAYYDFIKKHKINNEFKTRLEFIDYIELKEKNTYVPPNEKIDKNEQYDSKDELFTCKDECFFGRKSYFDFVTKKMINILKKLVCDKIEGEYWFNVDFGKYINYSYICSYLGIDGKSRDDFEYELGKFFPSPYSISKITDPNKIKKIGNEEYIKFGEVIM